MVLLASVLETELRKFMDPQYSGFQGWPTNDVDTATAWANAIDTYMGGGLAVTPPSASGAIAKTGLQTGLLGMSAPGAAIPIFDTAMLAYATSLAAGMSTMPAPFVGTPPIVPLTLTPPTLVTIVAAGLAGASSAEQAAVIATWIDTWFKTGTAVPAGGGPVVNWL